MSSRLTFLETHILRLAAAHGVAVPRLTVAGSVLARTAIDADVEALSTVIRALRRAMNDELFGLTTRPVPVGTFDFAMKSALHGRTLGEVLIDLITAAELMYSPPDLHCRMETLGGEVAVCFDNEKDPASALYFVWSFMSTHRGMCWLIDERILLRRVELRRVNNVAQRNDIAKIFQCEVSTAAARNALVFDKGYLGKQICRGLEDLNEYLRRRPLDVLYLPGQDRSLAARVAHLLRQHLESRLALPSAQQLARQLGLAEHKLRRQLGREGLTIQQLRDRVRQSLAAQQLAQTTLGIDAIARSLGYAETNSFYRAFKKWYGQSPQSYRQQHGAIG